MGFFGGGLGGVEGRGLIFTFFFSDYIIKTFFLALYLSDLKTKELSELEQMLQSPLLILNL